MQNNENQFLTFIEEGYKLKDLQKIKFSPMKPLSIGAKELIVRLKEIKSEIVFQFVFQHEKQAITKNHSFPEAIKIIRDELENFKNVSATRNSKVLQYQIDKNRLIHHKTQIDKVVELEHDKKKQSKIDLSQDIFRHLGLVKQNGTIVQKHKRKVRQIQKFIELTDIHLKKLSSEAVFNLYDLGCGKGYLTFALQNYFASSNQQINIFGIEREAHLVNASNKIASELQLSNLKFVENTIKAYEGNPDIVVSLHACNNATDDAIAMGINAGAKLIICSPCCYQELRPKLSLKNELTDIGKYGILLERQAEIVTDLLRSKVLELNQYKVKILEFVPSEHTPKNLLLIAEKRTNELKTHKSVQSLSEFKKVWGIETSYLEDCLNTNK